MGKNKFGPFSLRSESRRRFSFVHARPSRARSLCRRSSTDYNSPPQVTHKWEQYLRNKSVSLFPPSSPDFTRKPSISAITAAHFWTAFSTPRVLPSQFSSCNDQLDAIKRPTIDARYHDSKRFFRAFYYFLTFQSISKRYSSEQSVKA